MKSKKNNRKQFQNLHTHTFTSDGQLTYEETIQLSLENGINTVAFTDHDSLPSEKTTKKLLKSPGPVKIIIGIEISSGLPRELGNGPASNLHVVGLFTDPTNQALKNYCQKMRDARQERAQRILKNLRSLGFKITLKNCLAKARGGIVNRLHISQTLLANRSNLTLIKQIKEKMAAEASQNQAIRSEYQKLEERGPEQYPFGLLLGTDAYLKGVFVDHLYYLSFDRASQLIRNAGGIAILAHWTFIKPLISPKMIKKFLTEKRLDGLEVVYNAHTPGREAEILADMKLMKKIAQQHRALESGGADSHTRNDIQSFYQDVNLAEKTTGLAEKLIQSGKVDPAWSTLNVTVE
ncbi:MAG: PHP domain-containing protein [Candidatus Pacebacteria bacterium]|nr:PHP domain-containing protein [Candidatus Paceibacterota bacterium]